MTLRIWTWLLIVSAVAHGFSISKTVLPKRGFRSFVHNRIAHGFGKRDSTIPNTAAALMEPIISELLDDKIRFPADVQFQEERAQLVDLIRQLLHMRQELPEKSHHE